MHKFCKGNSLNEVPEHVGSQMASTHTQKAAASTSLTSSCGQVGRRDCLCGVGWS